MVKMTERKNQSTNIAIHTPVAAYLAPRITESPTLKAHIEVSETAMVKVASLPARNAFGRLNEKGQSGIPITV